MDIEKYAARIVAVVSQHVGHFVTVSGHYHTKVTEKQTRPDNVVMAYGGCPVHCNTCNISLSQQWN